MTRRVRTRVLLVVAVLSSLLLSACGRNMYDQPKAKAFQGSQFFADGSAMRPLPTGTVSREFGALEPAYLTGLGPNGFLADLPLELTSDLLQRGQERFDIFCSPCHNYNADGMGAAVLKGFPQPADFTTTQRLLDSPVGYFFNAATNGFGRMYSYASRVPVEDRWAIAAYIKALQLSQNAAISDVPAGAELSQAPTEANR
ncbi:MAG TPA: cytochrome c [Trueperaceae bacterium]|nr:cytochrome c [Trueperaceae bacterium]HRP47258.1 cytochrome c [Trueperaceae bacterium]